MGSIRSRADLRRLGPPVASIEGRPELGEGRPTGCKGAKSCWKLSRFAIRGGQACKTTGRAPRAETGRGSMAESVYKVIELVGTSTESWDKAASAAVERAAETLRDLRVAEVWNRTSP